MHLPRPLRIGLVYDLIGTAPPEPEAPADADAEYEPEETIALVEAALGRLGHRCVRLGSPQALLALVGSGQLPELDAALNLAEGYGSRNREAWAPILLELAGVPALGSDALTLSLSLDKAWAKDVAAAAGVPVAPHCCVASVQEMETAVLPGGYPLFVKPRWEGTAKGITPASRVEDGAALRREVERVVRTYRQPALVEPFLPGAEVTVTVVGNAPPRALPALQRALEERTGIGLHALERHAAPGALTHRLPGPLEPEQEARIAALAVRAFRALACRDFARVDFRLDAEGIPRFLEINPLPTFAREGSFGILAELAGRAVEDLLADVFRDALRRLGLS